MLNALKLCLLTDSVSFNTDYYAFIIKAIQSGVSSIQLRAKSLSEPQLLKVALKLKTLLAPYNVPLIINDNLAVAAKADAEGLHLGQLDGSPKHARKVLGQNKIIGLSIESLDELQQANQLDCIDYVAASSVFNSISKSNIKTVWGLDGLSHICQISKHPVIAIGGITTKNAAAVLQHGATGLAVISAIHQSKSLKQDCQLLTAAPPLGSKKMQRTAIQTHQK